MANDMRSQSDNRLYTHNPALGLSNHHANQSPTSSLLLPASSTPPESALSSSSGPPHTPDTPQSKWHTIRPWSPPLTLVVKEITSVSATFVLSSFHLRSPCTRHGDGELTFDLGEEDLEDFQREGYEEGDGDVRRNSEGGRNARSIIADALSKLSVTVNGSAWPRVFIRIDEGDSHTSHDPSDFLENRLSNGALPHQSPPQEKECGQIKGDRAVIIIYALMPGRQYDIDLSLASPSMGPRQGYGQQLLSRQITTGDDLDKDNSETHTDPESASPDNSTSSDPHSTPSTSPSRTMPSTPAITTSPQITLEDQLTQLQQSLTQVNAERDNLLASLKSARRESQKADASLRSEIDTLKRTSERNAAAEVRGKQKILALQEAVKRAQNATRETEELVAEVEEEMPELNRRKEEKEREHTKIKADAASVRKEREGVEEERNRRVDGMKAELTTLTHRLERLGAKKEKLEMGIPDLEEKLNEVEREIEQEELMMEMERQYLHGQESVPIQRPRHSSGEKLAPIGRPTPAPIQRPHGPPSPSAAFPSPRWSQPSQQSPLHEVHMNIGLENPGLPPHIHNARSQSFHANPSTPTSASTVTHLSHKPPRRSSLISNISSTQTQTNTTNTSPSSLSSSSSSPTRSAATVNPIAMTSTLSSRAVPFEPSGVRAFQGQVQNQGQGQGLSQRQSQSHAHLLQGYQYPHPPLAHIHTQPPYTHSKSRGHTQSTSKDRPPGLPTPPSYSSTSSPVVPAFASSSTSAASDSNSTLTAPANLPLIQRPSPGGPSANILASPTSFVSSPVSTTGFSRHAGVNGRSGSGGGVGIGQHSPSIWGGYEYDAR